MAFIYNGGEEPDNHLKALIVVPFQLDYASPTGTYSITVPAGYAVKEIVTVVTEVFDATTPSLTIGDGSDAAGYMDNTDIALGTAATATTPALKNSRNSLNPYANGKYYATADTVDFAWDDGTSGTTGVLKGWIEMINVKNGGVPAGATTKTPL